MATYGVITNRIDGQREQEIFTNANAATAEAEARAYAQQKALDGHTATVVLGIARYVPGLRPVSVTEL